MYSLFHYVCKQEALCGEAAYRNTLPTVVPWSINTGTKVVVNS